MINIDVKAMCGFTMECIAKLQNTSFSMISAEQVSGMSVAGTTGRLALFFSIFSCNILTKTKKYSMQKELTGCIYKHLSKE
jgi:hypothetical protein